ncbi:MAG: PAS domain S-box protein [Leptolyngbyaceae cyanobacterium SM1_4_3]|nr:PAS domain S-box protein [Leptolyngbyaceae cyanobacterium SM1_4_3]
MQTHSFRKRDAGFSLSTRQWGAMILAIPVVCLTVPLAWSLWLRQQSVADRPTEQPAVETDAQQLLVEQNQQLEQQRSLILVLAAAASIGILNSVAAWYFLNRLCRELQEQAKLLQESEKLTQAIATHVADGIITLHQGQIETFNSAATQMFGYEPAEVKGKEISLLLPLADEDGGAIAQSNSTQIAPQIMTGKLFQPVRQQRGMGKHKAGTPFPIEVSVSDIPVNDRRLVVIHDITAKEQAEAELKRQSNELNRLNTALSKTKSELQSVYVACYDLKSPLQAIAHLSKWIEADLNNWVVEETQPQMNLLRERVDRMEGLIHGILQQTPGKDEG